MATAAALHRVRREKPHTAFSGASLPCTAFDVIQGYCAIRPEKTPHEFIIEYNIHQPNTHPPTLAPPRTFFIKDTVKDRRCGAEERDPFAHLKNNASKVEAFSSKFGIMLPGVFLTAPPIIPVVTSWVLDITSVAVEAPRVPAGIARLCSTFGIVSEASLRRMI